jgi:hypothetical protein
VSYSGRVRDELQELIDRAKDRGLARQVLDALKEIDYRLRVYPQFGEPLRNLTLRPVQLWIASVPPLVVPYVLDQDRRTVSVGYPIVPLAGSGLEPSFGLFPQPQLEARPGAVAAGAQGQHFIVRIGKSGRMPDRSKTDACGNNCGSWSIRWRKPSVPPLLRMSEAKWTNPRSTTTLFRLSSSRTFWLAPWWAVLWLGLQSRGFRLSSFGLPLARVLRGWSEGYSELSGG